MKRHPFTLLLWAAAIFVAVGEVAVAQKMYHVAKDIQLTQGRLNGLYFGLTETWIAIRTGVIGGGLLAGMGAVIDVLSKSRRDHDSN